MDNITLQDPKTPLPNWKNGPVSVVHFVRRTLQPVVLTCAHSHPQFGNDVFIYSFFNFILFFKNEKLRFINDFLQQYIFNNQSKSVLCVPILLKKQLKVKLIIYNVVK